MAFAGIQTFMEKLKQLINCSEISPMINVDQIIHARPQFESLYQELGSMVQELFINQHEKLHEVEKVNDLKKRLVDAAEEAQHNIDLFLSGVHLRNNGYFHESEYFKCSLNLDDVMSSLKSIQMEIELMMHKMKMDSSQRREETINQSPDAKISITADSLGSKKV